MWDGDIFSNVEKAKHTIEKFTNEDLLSIEYAINKEVLALEDSIQTIGERVGGDVDTLRKIKEHYEQILEKVRKM